MGKFPAKYQGPRLLLLHLVKTSLHIYRRRTPLHLFSGKLFKIFRTPIFIITPWWLLLSVTFQTKKHMFRAEKRFIYVEHVPLHGKHIFFFRTSWKDGLSKKLTLEFDLSCIIGKNDISFSRNTPWTENERWSFRKDCLFEKIALEYDLSCIIWKDIYFLWTENGRWSFSRNT